MNLSEASELLLSIAGMRVELHETRSASFNRWLVGEHVIAWHRALSKKDLQALTLAARASGREVSAGVLAGDVMAIHTDNVEEKEAWILEAPETCFDSPHFAGYPAVLIDVERADRQVVLEIADGHADRIKAASN